MIEKQLLEIDPITGVAEYGYYDHATDEFTIETSQDLEPLVDFNRAQFNAQKRSTKHGDGTKIMSIPMELYMAEQKKGTFKDPKAFSRFVNDPDNAMFRTRPGKY